MTLMEMWLGRTLIAPDNTIALLAVMCLGVAVSI